MNENQNHVPYAQLVIDDTRYETRLTSKYKKRKYYEPEDFNQVRAFIPGIIKSIYVRQGQKVTENEPLFILEAMKMENTVSAPKDGVVKGIFVELNQMVAKNQLLLELE
jgi:biotin carboxyl carrier protein